MAYCSFCRRTMVESDYVVDHWVCKTCGVGTGDPTYEEEYRPGNDKHLVFEQRKRWQGEKARIAEEEKYRDRVLFDGALEEWTLKLLCQEAGWEYELRDGNVLVRRSRLVRAESAR